MGFIHLYFGNGKGKTTAAIGQCIRALGYDKKIIFAQFLKGSQSGEINYLSDKDNIIILRNSEDLGFTNTMNTHDIRSITDFHNTTLKEISHILETKQIDILVLDEILDAYNENLLDKDFLKKIINTKPDNLEIILTGRTPDKYFIEISSYITEMKKIKHPNDNKILARKGIEY